MEGTLGCGTAPNALYALVSETLETLRVDRSAKAVSGVRTPDNALEPCGYGPQDVRLFFVCLGAIKASSRGIFRGWGSRGNHGLPPCTRAVTSASGNPAARTRPGNTRLVRTPCFARASTVRTHTPSRSAVSRLRSSLGALVAVAECCPPPRTSIRSLARSVGDIDGSALAAAFITCNVESSILHVLSFLSVAAL